MHLSCIVNAILDHVPAKSDAGGASCEGSVSLMLKEILVLILSALPDWIVLFLMVRDRYDKWKNKRADGTREE